MSQQATVAEDAPTSGLFLVPRLRNYSSWRAMTGNGNNNGTINNNGTNVGGTSNGATDTNMNR